MREEIIKSVKKVIDADKVNLEVPEIADHGDYSTNIAMEMFGSDRLDQSKFEGNNPRDLAEKIVTELKKDENLSELVERIEVAGPGFINFYLSKKALLSCITNIYKDTDKYGNSETGKGKTVIVEYSSPNIAKPFTVGHLRSTVIGDAIANLLDATDWKVLRDNHLGDWGTQFGKQIYAIKTWGNEEEIEKSENPVKELVDLYVKFHEEAEKDETIEDKGREWFKKLEDGDPEARRIWQRCVDWSWKEFRRIYSVLGVSFSNEFNNGRGLGEAFFEDKMDPVIQELNSRGLLKEGEGGAKLVFFPEEKYPPAMILKKDGATLYHTRDLATDKYRLDNYKPNLIINEVGSEQLLYFRQLFEIEKLLGWYTEGDRVHVAHGLIRFKDKKMSTRKGNVIWLQDILGQVIDRAKELGSETEELATIVGVGALKYNDLKRDSKTEIVFDWDEMLSMEGNSGPYLQYTYARTQSLLRKSQVSNSELQTNLKSQFSNINFNDEELLLMRAFIHFPEVVESAAEKYAPNLVCNYLYDLAQRYNTFYNKHGILEDRTKDEDLTKFRLALTSATGQILNNGLNLLGIKAPEKM